MLAKCPLPKCPLAKCPLAKRPLAKRPLAKCPDTVIAYHTNVILYIIRDWLLINKDLFIPWPYYILLLDRQDSRGVGYMYVLPIVMYICMYSRGVGYMYVLPIVMYICTCTYSL